MSYSAVATYTTDKSADMFAQSGYEELGNDFFDQFITFSPVDDASPEYNLPENYLERSISNGDLSLSSTHDEHTGLWSGGDAWANSSASLPISGSQFYNELSGRAAISDSELLSLENINLESPCMPAFDQTSLPASPSPNATRRKSRIVESLSKTIKKATSSLDRTLLRSPIRKLGASPTMNRGLSNKSSLELQLKNFDFEIHSSVLPLSPPSSSKAPNAFQEADIMAPAKGKLLNGFQYTRNASGQQANAINLYDTPLSTPVLEASSSRVVSQDISAETGLFPITPQTQTAAPQWSHLPNSPEFNNAMYTDLESPLWYGNASTTAIAQPSPSGFHTNPQRATKSLAMQLQNDLAFSSNDLSLDPVMHQGLGIQMPIAQQFIMGSSSNPQIMQRGYYASPNETRRPQPQLQHRASQQNLRQQYQNQQTSGGPRHFSNENARPRSQHQSPYQYQSAGQNPGRSHSPIRRPNPRPRSRSPNSSSPSPDTPFTVRKRRSTNNTKKAAKGDKAAMVVDFVNYTPSDSRKILTGVAPSGSSKTKARREKEALEKRRRLSQAAVRAVRNAGGDLGELGEFIV